MGPGAEVQAPEVVTDGGLEVRIDEALGERPRGGTNVFHSFDRFDIGPGDAVVFSADSGLPTRAVISRVTGGVRSEISGLIRSAIPGADVILLNRAGVFFGPTAALDVAGALHVGAADEVVFGDGTRLPSRAVRSDAILTTAPPTAFGFMTKGGGRISANGSLLELQQGRVLSFVAPNIDWVDTTIGGRSGVVRLVTKGEAGDVDLADPRASGPGAIRIDRSRFNLRGNPGGSVILRSANIDLYESTLQADSFGTVSGKGIDIRAANRATLRGTTITTLGPGGDVTLAADRLLIDGGSTLSGRNRVPGRGSDLRIEASRFELSRSVLSRSAAEHGEGGGIFISATDVILREAGIESVTRGQGRAGDLDLAGVNVELGASVVQNLTRGSGRSGDIDVAADALMLRGSSAIFTETNAAGDSGDVKVSAGSVGITGQRARIASAANPQSTGRSGDVSIDAAELEISDGAFVASNTFGRGDGGRVSVRADQVRVDRGSITSQARPVSQNARSGDVSIEAGQLSISNRTQIASTTFSSGAAGRVSVMAEEIRASESSIESRTMSRSPGAGPAGVVSIDARQLWLRDGAFISTSSSGPGEAGDVEVRADDIDLEAAGIVSQTTSRALGGDAGSVGVYTRRLRLGPGAFVASSTFGPGQGGSVRVRATESIAFEGGARILAGSFSESPSAGDAGDVSISTDTLELSTARIATSAQGGGRAGSIGIEAGEVSLRNGRIVTDAVGGTEPGRPVSGSIQLSTARSVRLEEGARISASVQNGQGGDVAIDAPQFLTLRGGSEILAETEAGTGGQIEILSEAVVPDGQSRISADAGVGMMGGVVISSPDVNLEANLTALQAEYLDVEALRPGCEERGGAGGSFKVSRRRGLPPSPELLLVDLDAAGVGVASLRAAVDADPRWLSALQLADRRQGAGDYAGARVVLARSVERAERSGDGARIAAARSSLATAESALGRVERASQLLERSARLARDVGDPRLAAAVLNNLANQRALMGNVDLALALYAESASFARLADRPLARVRAIVNAARTRLRAGEVDASFALLREAALPPIGPADGPGGEAGERADADSREALLLRLSLASVYAEIATQSEVHRKASLLRADALLRPALASASSVRDPRALSYAFGLLGALYETDGRLDEALYLTREASARASRGATELLYRWYWQEGRVLAAQRSGEAAIAAYRRAVSALEKTRPESRASYGLENASFQDRLAPVYLDLADAILRKAARLDQAAATPLLLEARDTIERLKVAELRDYYRDECTADLEAKTRELDAVAKDAAVIYPIALRDRLELLVRLPSGLVRYERDVGSVELGRVAAELRRRLQDPATHGYLPAARKLYEWLVSPYEAELERQDVRTLVFVPDGALRTIPIGALHDGERFLAERFGHAVSPGLSLVDPKPLELEGARALLVGVSEGVQDFAPLPSVPAELEQIEHLFGGTVLLDRAFSPESIDTAVTDGRPTIVHIASHVVFTGDPKTSFLLTHDAKLPMSRLAEVVGRTRFRERPIELLTLSACRTALDGGQASLGLAGLAIRSGARSALGSLWRISDEATSRLMGAFYSELHEPGRSRAEALRRAQVKLIEDPALRHPYYWSPFLLVSNWL